MAKRIFVFFVCFFVTATICFAQSGKAEVVSFTGKVEYQTSEGWKPLRVGVLLDQGTVISTGFKSTLVLKIGGSNFTVAPLSRIAISKLTESDSGHDTEMQLSAGKLKIDVKPVSGKTASFRIKSPAATASIRGTSGEFSVDGVLRADTGVWSYTTAEGKKQMDVSAGQQIQVSSTGAIVKPLDVAMKAVGESSGLTKTLSSEETTISTGTVPQTTVTLADTPVVVKANATIEVSVKMPQ